MWILIIIVITGSFQGVAGNSSSVSTVEFGSEAACTSAAGKIAVDGATVKGNATNVVYAVRATCAKKS